MNSQHTVADLYCILTEFFPWHDTCIAIAKKLFTFNNVDEETLSMLTFGAERSAENAIAENIRIGRAYPGEITKARHYEKITKIPDLLRAYWPEKFGSSANPAEDAPVCISFSFQQTK